MIRKIIGRILSNRRKVELRQSLDRTRFAMRTVLRLRGVNRLVSSDLAPIFVVGSNRSGASLCTLIISKHPDVEGMFHNNPDSREFAEEDGHARNSVESDHIWRILNNPRHDLTEGENVLWGLPDFISKLYIKSVSDNDKKQLIDELMSARKTVNTPLINNNLNILRIPLLKEIFPNAKFVLVSRDHRSYIESCNDKWTKDREFGFFAPGSFIDHPHIGLHWLILNSVALYDLNKYAVDAYIHVKLQHLHGDASTRAATIDQVFQFLGLAPVGIDETSFDSSRAHIISMNQDTDDPMTLINHAIVELIEYERSATGDSEDS